jgi:hypothetical protein
MNTRIRTTSIETYRQIEAEGLLSRERWRVYSCVFHNGPLTSGEAFEILRAAEPRNPLSQSRARFTELRDMGVLCEIEERDCNISGRKCIVWDVTSNLPEPLPARDTRLSASSLDLLRSIWKKSGSDDRATVERVIELAKRKPKQ